MSKDYLWRCGSEGRTAWDSGGVGATTAEDMINKMDRISGKGKKKNLNQRTWRPLKARERI